MTWQKKAACRGMDPVIFHPFRGQPTEPAKLVCEACPVRGDCLEHALTNGERVGVWGGTSERERRRMRPKATGSSNQGDTCVAGHKLTEDNVYFTPKGYRRCRECARLRSAEWKANNPGRRRAS